VPSSSSDQSSSAVIDHFLGIKTASAITIVFTILKNVWVLIKHFNDVFWYIYHFISTNIPMAHPILAAIMPAQKPSQNFFITMAIPPKCHHHLHRRTPVVRGCDPGGWLFGYITCCH
jgi:hypothetical protein